MLFKKSRRKIVAAIMSILTVLWIGTLAIIYVSSYMDITARNIEFLQEHTDQFMLDKPVEGFNPMRPIPDRGPHWNDNQFKLSTFYSVAFSYGGEVIETKNDDSAIYSDNELEKLGRIALSKERSSGTIDNLVYYRTDKGGYTLVAFMDNTVLSGGMNTLFRYTLIFGGIALAALFFLAVHLAKKIVNPLEESYQKQRQFISDAGHELKTPVSVVNANAELLSREIGQNQWLQNIQYENERMGKLVGQLLELARTESVKPQMERIEFSHLVAGEALPFESVAFEQGLRLNENITQGLQINGNSTQLKQLVSILLDNAIRHGKGGKDVWLHLTKEHGYARLSVMNAGNEIPAEHREKLFERFYRVDDARNGEDKHYGLGLAIAKSIVDSHNGKIGVYCFDGIVEFRVMLPLA